MRQNHEKISIQQILIILGPTLLLIGLPLTLGGQILSIQIVAFCIATLSFGISLRHNFHFPKTPLFFASILSVYIFIQFLNPELEQEWQIGLRIWVLTPLSFHSWLPSSIKSSFSDMSPIRVLLLMTMTFFFGVAQYHINIKYQKRVVLPVLVLLSSLISLVGLIQLVLASRNILGLFNAADEGLGLFFGTFLYKNHAAAYLNLGLACSLACLLKPSPPSRKTRSSPNGLFLLLSFLILSGIIFSGSRFGFLCSLGILGSALPIFYKKYLHLRIVKATPFAAFVFFAILSLIACYSLLAGRKEVSHLTTINTDIVNEISYKQRILTYESGLKMFLEKPIFGWGAGNFRHGFRQFQDLESEESKTHLPHVKKREQIYFWQHAHNDYLEYLIELGVVGTLILFSIPGYLFWMILRSKRWKEPVPLILLVGLATTMIHALIDFPFRNPAVMLFWFGILVLTTKLCTIDISHRTDRIPRT